MVINLGMNWENFYNENILAYIKSLQENPFELVTLIIDIAIVIFLVYCFFKIVSESFVCKKDKLLHVKILIHRSKYLC